MKNKQINRMLALGLSVAMLSGCGGEVEPLPEEETTPSKIITEEMPELESDEVENEEDEDTQDENATENDADMTEDFNPEWETEVCVYGPAPEH